MNTSLSKALSALDAAAEEARTPRGTARIIFGIDATGSREASWEAARKVQSQMFTEAARYGTLQLQLITFGGSVCRASKFTSSPDVLAGLMASITCISGGTQIADVLGRAIDEQTKEPLAAFIYIGDAQEEDQERLLRLASQLKCPGFFFQEGTSIYVAEDFKALASTMNGAYSIFDSSSPAKLAELLRAVAAFATGGMRALRAQGTEAATLLLSQLK